MGDIIEVLRFYADPKNWQRPLIHPNDAKGKEKNLRGSQLLVSAVEEDHGKLARKALEELNRGK